ncbi:phosphotransferase enzyme family protein [Paenibacillus oceani]|uniref:Phosphotransferase n=1 Tax=Paenibacillus oceani TaxID=2772510 RepID=A0A927H2U9_9BACL|nr:phosphotransferase [Paenibacillus oceani]MBD2865667.1 phosphotransferase [Paenibacillus oceani]
MEVFPVTHSILSERALANEILPFYFTDTFIDCRLLVRGMNDSYLVRAKGVEYILRAYRHGHRTLSDIQHELDLLQHLHLRGVRVAYPVDRRDGEFVTEVLAPEGTRYVAVFTYAPGTLWPLSPDIAAVYGQAAARLHQGMELFISNHQRYSIDIRHLLDDRVPRILPLLAHRPNDQYFVSRLWRLLQKEISIMAPDLKRGLCHGDLNGGNCHMDDERRVTFFDFDCEGFGWAAYDVAVFNWSVRDMPNREFALQLWQAYIGAYQNEMPLSDADIASIPYFVAARQLWLVGLHCQHADEWTYGNLNDAYFDRRLRILYELVREENWEL